ncbi:efflux RND transporter permease subunit [Chitinophaga sp. 30R24]|uniref:efflux RND transporter permease subunit n=1 Tax=Chitinophaga sp. 30R24 TaxID=3248838 RepID=UPI003B8F1CB7
MISKTFIERKNTTIVVAIIIVIVGLICMFNLPIAQLPDIVPPVTDVKANYVGANSTTVEETVTTPIENQVNGTPGAMYIQSVSANDGSMDITVTFKLGTDPDISTLDVQNRVSLALPSTPDEVRRVGVTVKKRSNDLLMLVALNSPRGTHSREFLDNYLNIYLKPELSRIFGVGDVTPFSQDYSMRIWLNPDKMAALGLTAGDVANAVLEQNQQVPAGSIGAPPMGNMQAFEYTVSVKGRLATSEEFGNIVVAKSSNGSLIRLKDVARVNLGSFAYSVEVNADAKTGTGMGIYLSPGANALNVNDAVMAKMKEMAKTFPDDVNWLVPFESTSFVRISIEEVIETFLEAMVLVIIVVFVFLQNWRATIIPILVIPISLIGTFIFFQLLGFSINTLTLFGFVLAIGIVVDDAIVVVEAVQHHIDADLMSPREATYKAMSEVQGPVIAIALILAAVFVPVAFIPGVSGRLYQQFALTIAFSVLLSAFLALTFTPALTSVLLKPALHQERRRGLLDRAFNKFNEYFSRFTNGYGNLVRHSIRLTPLILVVMLIIFALAFYLFKKTPTTFVPQEDMGSMFLALELPEAASTERTKEVLGEVNQILLKDPAVLHFFGVSGFNFVANATKPNSGTFFVGLKPWDERYAHGDDMNTVAARITQATSKIVGANIVVIPSPTLRGLGNTGGFSFMLEQRSNPDINQFLQVMGAFLAAANQRPEIARAYAFFSANTPQFNLDVDRDKCKQLGVAVGDVFSALQTFLGGYYVNDFTRFSRSFRVVLQADSLYRTSINSLNTYYVRNSAGGMVPLSALITTKPGVGAPVINHFNLYRSVEIDGDSKKGYSSGDAINALQEVAAKVLPENFSYEWANVSLQEIEAGNKSVMIFVLSILFVFLLLTALYESWSVPFSVLLAVPIALFGSILALTLSKQANSVYSQIGLITLIGLAAKNAILIVEFCKERVDRGMPLLDATLEAVKLRLRPILMTSFAFILGVMPLCVAKGAGAASRINIGFTVVGGMLAATILGIFTVPVLYVLITKYAYGKKKLAELEAYGNEEKKPKGLGE